MEHGEDHPYELTEKAEEDSSPEITEEESEEEASEGGPYELTEEEAEEMFAILAKVIKEEEEEKKEKELSKWLVEWKVLADEAEALLRRLGFTDEIVYVEAFEEIMDGEVVDEGEVVELDDEDEDDVGDDDVYTTP